jgi:polyhydroxybutyrate depolymerase
MQTSIRAVGAALVTTLAFGCASSDGGGGASGASGGFVSSGGSAASGGLTSSGGFVASGGLTSSGGFVASGGLTSSGGFVASGGLTASGGFPVTGGATGTGGDIASGGTAGSGGASSGGTGGTVGTGGAPATACTGKPGSKRGKSNQTVTAGGAARTFVYYAPAGLDASQPVPIVIVPHGFTMSGQAMYDITAYSKVADREKFVAIFPDGEPASAGPWNVGTGVCGAGAFVGATGNDQAFVDEMIKFVEADQCVDHNHIYMSGFSMGGYFSHESGCLRTDIRAIGPHSGGTHDLSACKSTHKPVIMFHFKGDSLIAYSCATDARDKWVARNGCSKDAPTVTTVKGGTCEYYQGCPADGQVALCSFDEPAGGGGETLTGHAWSGGVANAFSIPQTESATELGWAFFKKYAW